MVAGLLRIAQDCPEYRKQDYTGKHGLQPQRRIKAEQPKHGVTAKDRDE